MTTVATEKRVIKGMVSVRPYINPSVENMGLERHDMVLHQGTTHKEFLTCLEVHGIRRHLTGLDEFAPEIEKMIDVPRKNAVIKQIRTRVAFLEKMLAANDLSKYIDSKDPKEFWDRVEQIKRDNYKMWDGIFLEMSNEPLFFDPKNPDDLIKICAIEAGGFSEIAKSLDDARSGSISYKFYLDKEEETSASRTQFKKIKNQALALLEELYNKEPKKLWWIAKNIDANSSQYKHSTSNEVVYDRMDTFINGQGIEKSISKAAQGFITYAEQSLEHLRIRGVVRDAAYFRFILHKPDGNMYHNVSSVLLGKNIADCVEFFKQGANATVWESVLKEVEAHLKE